MLLCSALAEKSLRRFGRHGISIKEIIAALVNGTTRRLFAVTADVEDLRDPFSSRSLFAAVPAPPASRQSASLRSAAEHHRGCSSVRRAAQSSNVASAIERSSPAVDHLRSDRQLCSLRRIASSE